MESPHNAPSAHRADNRSLSSNEDVSPTVTPNPHLSIPMSSIEIPGHGRGSAHVTRSPKTRHPAPQILPDFPLKGPFLSEKVEEHDYWEQLHAAIEKHDNELCSTWREDIDTLLVFAGLFTAIVTAFTIESYQWLQPGAADMTNQLLLGLSKQLADPQLPFLTDPSNDFVAPSYAIRINCFWFLSITISLASGAIGILCKQWMREFQRDASLPAKDALGLRQLRWMAWEKWGVPHIISLPAMLLQVALLLFLGGLTDLLWSKLQSRPVAACATVAVGMIIMILVLTTVLPFVYFLSRGSLQDYFAESSPSYPCPFKSPQSSLLLKLWDHVYRAAKPLMPKGWKLMTFRSWLDAERRILRQTVRHCGTDRRTRAVTRYRSLAIQWIKDTLSFNQKIGTALYHCIQGSPIFCGRMQADHHTVFCGSEKECQEDLGDGSHRVIYEDIPDFSLSSVTLLEVLLRGVGTNLNAERAISQTLWDAVFRTARYIAPWTSREVPLAAGQQTLLYLKYCIVDAPSETHPLALWMEVMVEAIMAPTYELQTKQILDEYCISLPDRAPELRTELSNEFIQGLHLAIKDGRAFNPPTVLERSQQNPAAVLSLLKALKCSGMYMDTHASRDFWGVGEACTVGEKYKVITAFFLQSTPSDIIPRGFFEDVESQPHGTNHCEPSSHRLSPDFIPSIQTPPSIYRDETSGPS